MSREDGGSAHGLCERCSSAPCLCANAERLREQVEAQVATVHILKYGRSYCEMPGTPNRWPPGHQWVSFEDDWQKDATCEQCRAHAAAPPPVTLADGRGLAARPVPPQRSPEILAASQHAVRALYAESTITPEVRRFLQALNSRGRLVTTEVTREGRRRGTAVAVYFAGGDDHEKIANKLINVFMRTRFQEP